MKCETCIRDPARASECRRACVSHIEPGTDGGPTVLRARTRAGDVLECRVPHTLWRALPALWRQAFDDRRPETDVLWALASDLVNHSGAELGLTARPEGSKLGRAA